MNRLVIALSRSQIICFLHQRTAGKHGSKGAFTAKARHFLSETPKEHLEKPFDSANLRAIVQRYLR
jgi:hypothetical protein